MMQNIIAIDGWALDAVVALDEAFPGFAGAFFRASSERRQVIAAFLAANPEENSDLLDQATFLVSANHQRIIARAFGHSPEGMRRALAKSGAQPLPPEYYQGLFDALSNGTRAVVTTIKQSVNLDEAKLKIIGDLPDDLCDARITNRLEGRQEATDLVAAVDFMTAKGINRTAFVAALLKSTGPVKSTIRRWSLRLPFPPPPIPASSGHRPLRNGRELKAVALRYQNCSRRYLTDSVVGKHAFAEFTLEDGRQVLIVYERKDGVWYFEDAYSRRNRYVAKDVREAVRDFTGRHGIVEHRTSRPRDEGVEALRRFNSAVFDW